MKNIFIIGILFCVCSFTASLPENETKKKILGTWTWSAVINSTNQETMGVEAITMGMAKQVKTEFKEDGTMVEYKWREGKDEPSSTKGEWKLSEDGTQLEMKPKEKWMKNKIIKLSGDSLITEMNPQMQLLMIKDK